MKKLTLLTLSLALLLPLTATTAIAVTAATENNCERAGKSGAWHKERQHRMKQQQDPLTLQEIEVLAQAQALRRLGTGATAVVTPEEAGGYLIELRNAGGETLHSHKVSETGYPEHRRQRPAGAVPAS